MSRNTAWVLALVLTCAPASAAARSGESGEPQGARPEKPQDRSNDKGKNATNVPDERERWKWWLYDRAELGITDQQSRDINQIFESTLPKLRETRQEMERAEAELSQTIKEHKADLATISLLIDRVESARSQNTKLRVLMLYRIDLLLNGDQRAKVHALRARQEAARRERDKEQPGHRRRP
jgi:Spy/CpxP family protein refolding chaperone